MACCQSSKKIFFADSLSREYFNELKKEFGHNKQYPPQFEKPILIALSYYPGLKNTPIYFRTRKRHSIAVTRTTWSGFFASPGKRHYVITISDNTEEMLLPLLFSGLRFNTQVGLIGHELGHVVQYSAMNTLQLIKYMAGNISAKYIDRFEYRADSACIAHGLGYQLLEWSSFVRKTMNTENWLGPDYAHRPKKRERYMNPGTILRRINSDKQYELMQ
ncbi:MAG: hypothetical protein WDO16_14935 [Bacteroidota bacterium]